MEKLHELSAVALAELVRKRELSAEEVTTAHLEQIARREDTVAAWAYFNPEYALEQARAIDKKTDEGKPLGELAGVPVGLKDIFNTTDMPTAMGSPQWQNFTPGNDARVVHYMRLEDAVFPGKTVTAEFAVHAPGKTRNPQNPDYSPGTSSSGSAAAVAAAMVPVSIGTQTAGSIVRPASYCGVYGFKPSFGLLPRTGVLKTVDTLDTVGMFARNVLDLALLFGVMRVKGVNFPISDPILADPQRQTKGNRPWRILVPASLLDKFSQPYARTAFEELIAQMAKHTDVEIVRTKLPPEVDEAHQIHETIYERSLSYYFQREFSNTKFISAIIHEMISKGKTISQETYWQAIEKQNRLYKIMDDYFSQGDVLLTLSTQGIAPLFEGNDVPDSCLIWTLCGLPAISLPLFKGPEAMPFGLQMVGRRYNDYLLLRCAEFIARNFKKAQVDEVLI